MIRVEHEYEREAAVAYLADCDVHRPRLFGRTAATAGIEPFGRVVEQVMTLDPYASILPLARAITLFSSMGGPTGDGGYPIGLSAATS
jgi:hypothetical protein